MVGSMNKRLRTLTRTRSATAPAGASGGNRHFLVSNLTFLLSSAILRIVCAEPHNDHDLQHCVSGKSLFGKGIDCRFV